MQSINMKHTTVCLDMGREVKRAIHSVGKHFCIKCINSCVNDVGYEKCY